MYLKKLFYANNKYKKFFVSAAQFLMATICVVMIICETKSLRLAMLTAITYPTEQGREFTDAHCYPIQVQSLWFFLLA